jgi:hypothetical protein
VKISALGLKAVSALLARGDLLLKTPPFVARLSSTLPRVAEDLCLLYPEFELAEPGDFADFHLEVRREAGLRGWFKPMARFYADGEPAFSTLPVAQAFHMVEWGLNWAVTSMAHQYLIYHAAALERGGRALLLPAPPGSGKSTLSAALAHRGWRLLSDELALTTPVADTLKGTLALMRPPAASVAAVHQTAQPAWIVLPRYQALSETRLSPMPKAEMLLLLAEQSFNYDTHGRAGFEATADLVDRCDCFEFVYSSLDEATALFAGLADNGAPS